MRALSLFPAALSLVVLLGLAGCNAPAPESRPGTDGDVSTSANGSADHAYEDIPPATAPPGSVMPGQAASTLEGATRWDGIGEAQFGMDGEQVEMVWPGKLTGYAEDGSACFHLTSVGQDGNAEVAMMFVEGPLVRYAVSTAGITAPGGGKGGMDIAQIEAQYPGLVAQSSNKDIPGGHVLRIQEDSGDNVLAFDTDAAGIVIQWAIGIPSADDYFDVCR